jgi:hypothetical protein
VRTGYGLIESERLADKGEPWRAAGFHVSIADNAAEAIRRWARAPESAATLSNRDRLRSR